MMKVSHKLKRIKDIHTRLMPGNKSNNWKELLFA